MTERAITACCSVSAYADPVSVTGIAGVGRKRIGEVPRCGKCHAFKGDFRPDRNGDKEVLRLLKLWTGSSWRMAVDDQIKRPGSPLIFEEAGGFLKPVGYVPAQTELTDDEVPF